MAKRGRKHEDKVWETSFRHVLRTGYLADSDLHILVYIAGSHINDVMCEALRDYMAKHNIKAADPEFQMRVCMQANMQMARDKISPIAEDVLEELGELDALDFIKGGGVKSGKPGAAPAGKGHSQQPQSTPTPIPPPPRVAAPTVIEPPFVAEVSTGRKPVELDFGPEEVDEGSQEGGVVVQKASIKDKWLKGHNYA